MSQMSKISISNGTQCNRTKQSLYNVHGIAPYVVYSNETETTTNQRKKNFSFRLSCFKWSKICTLRLTSRLWLLFNAVSGFEVSLCECEWVSAGAYLQNRCSIVFVCHRLCIHFYCVAIFNAIATIHACRLVFFVFLFIELVMCVILLLLLYSIMEEKL